MKEEKQVGWGAHIKSLSGPCSFWVKDAVEDAEAGLRAEPRWS